MVYSDDFRELIENAHDAVQELLNGSTNDSWMTLRSGYGQLRKALEADDLGRNHARHASAWEQQREQRDAWRAMPWEARENLLLDVLGDESLIASELAARMNRELCERQRWTMPVLDNGRELEVVGTEEARRVALRLLDSGELERTARERGKKIVQHFSRNRGLDGPIADLERAYHDDGEAP